MGKKQIPLMIDEVFADDLLMFYDRISDDDEITDDESEEAPSFFDDHTIFPC
jgi:hypothetical protein